MPGPAQEVASSSPCTISLLRHYRAAVSLCCFLMQRYVPGIDVCDEVEESRSTLAYLTDASGQELRKAPDGGLCCTAMVPRMIREGGAPPLVEVGCENEEWLQLLDEARTWLLHPNVKVHCNC